MVNRYGWMIYHHYNTETQSNVRPKEKRKTKKTKEKSKKERNEIKTTEYKFTVIHIFHM